LSSSRRISRSNAFDVARSAIASNAVSAAAHAANARGLRRPPQSHASLKSVRACERAFAEPGARRASNAPYAVSNALREKSGSPSTSTSSRRLFVTVTPYA
jgi:hypothetical protein